jgi:RNA polymerase sigma factor (sigma-70 family)
MEIMKIPLLTQEEERELIERLSSPEAKEKLVHHNMKLVMKLAAKKQTKLMGFEDCFQEGVIGLMEATNKFDKTKDVKFSTYAYFWILQAIYKAKEKKMNIIRIPAMKMYQKDSEDQLVRCKLLLDKSHPNDDRHTLKDFIPDPKSKGQYSMAKENRKMLIKTLDNILQKYSERDRYLLYSRLGFYGEIKLYKELAKEVGVSKQRVEQIVLGMIGFLKTRQQEILEVI